MIEKKSSIHLIKYLLIVLFFLILLCPFPASSASVSMEYSLGFNGLFSLNRWTPLNIVLENRGRTIYGLLEVVVTSGSEYRRDVHDTTFSMDVELPTNSKKLYSFTIFIDSFTHPLMIRLKDSQKTILFSSINLRPHYVNKPLVLIVGSKIPPDFSSVLPKRVLPISSRPQFLPEAWYGYDGVEMLIMQASVWKNLRQRQLIALNEWVKSGGYLITGGGLNYGSLLNEKGRRLISVNILGFKRIFELNSLEKFCGQRLTSSDPFLVVKAEIEESVTLIEEDDIPIIIQKGVGLGKVIFLAFDYQSSPFTEWTGKNLFWNRILSLRPLAFVSGIDHKEQEILSSMISEIPAHFPAFLLAFPFFALYIILTLFILKRIEISTGQRWRYLGYLMTIIIVFSAASYWFFFFKNSQKNLSYNGFLHMKISGPNSIASFKYMVGLYTLQEGQYRLSFGQEFYPVTALRLEKYKEETLHNFTLHERNTEQNLLVSLDRWSHRFFRINARMNFPISGKAFMDEQGLMIAIENTSPFTIVDCYVYFANRFLYFGSIDPGKKQVKRLNRSSIDQKNLFQVQEVGRITEDIVQSTPASLLKKIKKDIMKDLLLSIHFLYNARKDTLYLFGWIESNVISTRLDRPGIAGEGVTLLEWEIPIDPFGGAKPRL